MAIIFPPALGSIPSPASLTPALVTTIFYAEAAAGTHASTDWQIAESADFASASIVYDQNDAVNLTSLTVPAATLQSNVHYYARIRHRGSNGDISNWSKTADFNTGLVIETPTITVTSPTQLQPIIQSSQFVGVRTHTRTDWEIATDYLFTNVVESSYDDPVNLTQFTPSNLSFDTLYYVKSKI